MTNEIKPIPNSPQELLLKSSVREVGFGGQAGGAKSFSIILDALYQLPKKGYNAILFRRTYPDLKAADGLIDISKKIYPSLGGRFNQSDHIWTFPDYFNNTIRFSHMQHESDAEVSGPQYQYIAFDELQEFTERMYLFLFSRNRSSNPDIDCYMRSTFNPGGIGHFWIKNRFIKPFYDDGKYIKKVKYFTRIDGIDTETDKSNKLATDRLFIPSRLEDNPYLWQDGRGEYLKSLHQLDNVDFRRLRHGDWDIRRAGRIYHQFDDKNIGPASYDLDMSKVEGYYHSHDFGAVNRAWGLYAKIGKKYYLIHEEILPEGTSRARAAKVTAHFKDRKVIAGWGGSSSEKQQRSDYTDYGISIRQLAITSVESQIDKTNKMFENETLMICSDMLLTIDQLENCVRDDKGGIQDKSKWHHLDVLRYFATGVNSGGWVR